MERSEFAGRPAVALRLLCVLLVPLLTAGTCSGTGGPVGGSATPPTASTPSGARLEVGYISRDPRLTAPTSLQADPKAGWPEEGRAVHWVAHVLNRGSDTVSNVAYAWRIDGDPVETGYLDVPPGETEVRMPWTWTFTRHAVNFTIVPPPGADDATTDDDQVTVASDALAIGFWVEKGLYDWMALAGRPGFEREMQDQIQDWNAILADRTFPTAPTGVRDRVRLDKVVVFPDGGESALSNSDFLDVDLWWRMPDAASDQRFLHIGAAPAVLANQRIVLHELLHQRGLVDLYAYTVIHHPAGTDDDGRVDIEENGKPIVGTFLMPPLDQSTTTMVVYHTPYNGLMGQSISAALTELDVDALNLVAGRRSPMTFDQWGNLIIGLESTALPESYVYKLPETTTISFVDQGARVTGGAVDVYLDHNRFAYSNTYTAGPDLTLPMAADGTVTLRGDVLSRLLESLPPFEAPPKAQDIVFGVRTSRGRAYVFQPVYALNLRYFRDHGGPATLEAPVTLVPW